MEKQRYIAHATIQIHCRQLLPIHNVVISFYHTRGWMMVFQNRNYIFGYTSVSSTCYILVNEQPKQNNAFSSLGFWENADNDMDILEKCFERISDGTP